MSDYAVTKIGGEPLSAWEYRSIYLGDGTKYEMFYCPFCDIRLCDRLIYKDGELSKSPHFAAVWESHKFGCDGEPIAKEQHNTGSPKSHYIKRLMHVPEVLVARPAPRTVTVVPRLPEKSLLLGDVLERRRKAATAGMAQPKTYLLQPIVEARNSVVSEGFDRAREKGWSDTDRKAWLKHELSQLPLTLEQKTNYDNGFRTPAYIDWNYRRIYHGIGQVTELDGCYTVQCDTRADLKSSGDVAFIVLANMNILFNGGAPRSHVALAKRLKEISSNVIKVKWYAYGLPLISDGTCQLHVENLDYLYFKSDWQKKN